MATVACTVRGKFHKKPAVFKVGPSSNYINERDYRVSAHPEKVKGLNSERLPYRLKDAALLNSIKTTIILAKHVHKEAACGAFLATFAAILFRTLQSFLGTVVFFVLLWTTW